MKTILEEMVLKYEAKNNEEKSHAIKEVMQEIILCSLSKAGFFKEAAFYGGTALRIFYGLDRFSEDLDFSSLIKKSDFRLEDYFQSVKQIVSSFGLNVELEVKEKTKNSSIKSAFLKANTIEEFLVFYPSSPILDINKSEKIKIKFKVDITPSSFATYKTKFRLLPIPYSIKVFDQASLFSCNIHALISKDSKDRVKGRDLYDYVFYLSKGIKFNRNYLKAKLVDSEYIKIDEPLNLEKVKEILKSKFSTIDFEEAKDDVFPFIKDPQELDMRSKDFFTNITNNLEAN